MHRCAAQVADAATKALSAKGWSVIRPELSQEALTGRLKWEDYLDWVRQMSSQAREDSPLPRTRAATGDVLQQRLCVLCEASPPSADASAFPPSSQSCPINRQGVHVLEIHGQDQIGGLSQRPTGVVARESALLARAGPSRNPAPPSLALGAGLLLHRPCAWGPVSSP